MDHASVNSRLSAYLDGAVAPEEKALIEEHLRGCERCRSDLRELRQTVLHLRNLGEEEPPPWLTRRIMARVEEEAERRGGWLRRLFLPLRWKLPVEAAALVFLTVTGYLVYRAVSPEVPPIVPPALESRKEAPAPVPREAVPAGPSEESPGKGGAGPVVTGSADARRSKKAAPPAAQPGGVTGAESSPPMPPPAPGAAAEAENKGPAPAMAPSEPAGSQAARDSAADLGKAKGESFAERAAPSPAARAKALSQAPLPKVRLGLIVADENAAVLRIESVTRRLGGKIVRSARREGGRELVVRLDLKMLREFTGSLGSIGTVREASPVPAGEEGPVEVTVEVISGADQ